MIKKTTGFFIATSLLLTFLTSCNFFKDCTNGEGEVVEEQLEIATFEEIELIGDFDLYLSQGETQKISIKAQSNLIELMNTSVSRGKWKVDFDPCVNSMEAIEIYVQVPKLSKISVEGAGNIGGITTLNTNKIELSIEGSGTIELDLDTKELSSKIKGSGNLRLTGNTKKHQIEVNGSGDVNAFELSSAETDIEINGSGDVEVDVSYALSAKVNGSGDIYYKGSVKKINSNIDGSGKLNQAN